MYIYLIDCISTEFMVVLSDLQAIEDATICPERGDFDRVARGEKR